MRDLKIAIIGAGSTYTPELIEGIIQRKDVLSFKKIYFMDIDKNKLDIVGGLSMRMLKKADYDCETVLTDDLDESLKDADYVFAQIRVGRLDARVKDEQIPMKYGLLGQETTGIGGFMKALRTVPVIVDIAKRMEVLAPNAWLLNFSNPSGIVAQAVLDHTKTKMIGLCNCPINMVTDIAKAIGTSDYDYTYVGLNHLSWITSIIVDGKDVISEFKDSKAGQMKNVPTVEYDMELQQAIPSVPSSYLSYFYLRDQQIEKSKEGKCRGEVCKELEESLLEQYKNSELDIKPVELETRGGALYSTAAISLVDAIENDKNEYHVIDVKNHGSIPFMQDEDVVEVKCLVNREGVKPLPVEDVKHPYIIGMMQAVKAYEKLAVSAAMNGSRTDALAALMVHPLIGDYDKASKALNELIEAHKDFLPNFYR